MLTSDVSCNTWSPNIAGFGESLERQKEKANDLDARYTAASFLAPKNSIKSSELVLHSSLQSEHFDSLDRIKLF
jgi:hypothetical protein